MYDHAFYPIRNKPTRITQISNPCIHHIWTYIHDKKINSAIIIIHKIADHLPVVQSTKIINIKTALPNARNFSKRNSTLFNEGLSEIDPSDIQVLMMQWIPLCNNILIFSIHISH